MDTVQQTQAASTDDAARNLPDMTKRLLGMAKVAERAIAEKQSNSSVKKETTRELMEACKWIFDYAGRRLPKELLGPVPNLVVDGGMDAETVWEQVQLRNENLQSWLQERVETEVTEPDLGEDKDEEEEEGFLDEDGEAVAEDGAQEEEWEDDGELEGNESGDPEGSEDDELDEAEEEGENDEAESSEGDSNVSPEPTGVRDSAPRRPTTHSSDRDTSIVADEFFRLEDMERFAEEFEKKDIMRAERENRKLAKNTNSRKGENIEDDESEEGDEDEDGDVGSDGENDGEEGYGDYEFQDFFDPPPQKASPAPRAVGKVRQREDPTGFSFANRATEMRSMGSREEEDKEYTFDLDGPQSTNDGEEEEVEVPEDPSRLSNKVTDLFADDAKDGTSGDGLSTFERAQHKLRQRTEELEKELTSEKHWALKGEVTARSRPVNSLLEEALDFDHATRPAPMVTDESGRTLEDMIRRRILDGAFDDVERRVDERAALQARGAFDPNRMPDLSEEKSKKSLAEEYEAEFVKQKTLQQGGTVKTAKDEQLDKQHGEIDALFTALSRELDALSAWHYTPAPPKSVLKVIPSADTPAIAMEEATPAFVSDAKAAAPEEVYRGPRRAAELKAKEETDVSERTRERKRKKKLFKLGQKQKAEEDKALKVGPGVRKPQDDKKSALKALVGKKGVTVLGADGKEKGNKASKPGKGLSKLGRTPESASAGKKRKVDTDSGNGGDAKRQKNFKL